MNSEARSIPDRDALTLFSLGFLPVSVQHSPRAHVPFHEKCKEASFEINKRMSPRMAPTLTLSKGTSSFLEDVREVLGHGVGLIPATCGIYEPTIRALSADRETALATAFKFKLSVDLKYIVKLARKETTETLISTPPELRRAVKKVAALARAVDGIGRGPASFTREKRLDSPPLLVIPGGFRLMRSAWRPQRFAPDADQRPTDGITPTNGPALFIGRMWVSGAMAPEIKQTKWEANVLNGKHAKGMGAHCMVEIKLIAAPSGLVVTLQAPPRWSISSKEDPLSAVGAVGEGGSAHKALGKDKRRSVALH
ncbi:hypothetical protein BKA70DRAFT_1219991 [Coprinopsis sp. MPI-PUGE-AT-0042]|nr:hypothetical protein BKA70DRAFT_1219991 [Coprinopsis sp. MPI-PUGE-AT-0042]